MADNGRFTYHLDDYDYPLPEGLIAQAPPPDRQSSRLLVLNRSSGELSHYRFEDLVRFLKDGDLLVINDTRVVPARLVGAKETGGRVELLVLDPYKDPQSVEKEGSHCLVKSSKPPREGTRIVLRNGVLATFLSPVLDGKAFVRLPGSSSLLELLSEIGEVPLPPYIDRNIGVATVDDASAYQTVYASRPGAVAAPTAGLHFSTAMLDTMEERGVERASITLHVGYGTFAPIRTRDIRDHRMHREYVEISEDSASRIRRARREGRRIVAVGTTVVRALEWVSLKLGHALPFSGWCDHFIYPGYPFRVVDALVTNFHLPKSTLLLLVSAFAGREAILHAYQEAIREKYRFFSYGDAMLIL